MKTKSSFPFKIFNLTIDQILPGTSFGNISEGSFFFIPLALSTWDFSQEASFLISKNAKFQTN